MIRHNKLAVVQWHRQAFGFSGVVASAPQKIQTLADATVQPLAYYAEIIHFPYLGSCC